MTDYENSVGFADGFIILNKYRNEKFTIAVIEQSAISVRGLNLLSVEDCNNLRAIGWEAGNQDDFGWADYYKLDYGDT